MKRNQSKVVSSIIVAVFALMAGCASMPSAEVLADQFQIDSADSRP
jgi:hypothetical protein